MTSEELQREKQLTERQHSVSTREKQLTEKQHSVSSRESSRRLITPGELEMKKQPRELL